MRYTPANTKGFTLIEIMVVIVILCILAAVVVPNIMGRPDEARITKAKQDVRALETALDLYKLDNFNYPTTEQGLEALVTKPTTPPEPKRYREEAYLKKVPKDPWENEYQSWKKAPLHYWFLFPNFLKAY